MISVKTSASIKTSSEIRSFRSLRHFVGAPLRALDQGRMQLGLAKRLAKHDHRVWRAAQGR
ncbi:MAG: hypothetical protein EOM91_03800 [Sphingobacteriia bacterium]|nr:hypothetical protein [Sphingobacteriia bacterium]NCC38422.1 hypothetical protein [Gammaproteobacteria bacterium]